jgi:glucosamine--fructose-6-phosphate aminotransferase (isomerizing)
MDRGQIHMQDSIMIQEVLEQPEVVQTLLDEESGHVQELTSELRGKFHHIIIAARGTSDNAARYAQYLFGAHNRIPVGLAAPSLYTLYLEPPLLTDSLVIGISQSGQSPDIVAVLGEAKNQGQPTLAITNDLESPLAQTADHVIQLHAGFEKAVAATKTYTASLAALALFSACLGEPGQPNTNPEHLEQLQKAPSRMQQTLDGLKESLIHTERFRFMDQCTVIGRGYNYSTAFEIALKIKELTHVLAEPYSSADFRHGPIAVIHRGYPVILVIPSGAISAHMVDMLEDLRRLNCEVILISDIPDLLAQAQMPLPIPRDVPEWLSPLVTVLPGQLFSYQLTLEKGLNPDQPEGLTKVTSTF